MSADLSPPSSRPPSALPAAPRYEPFIEGVRGLLAVYVVFFHLTTVIGYVYNEGDPLDARGLLDWTWYGHYAVVAFIFISGLCLGMPVVRNLEAGQPPLSRGVAAFYQARFRRILPAYYAALLLSTGIAIALHRLGYVFPPTYFLPVNLESIIGAILLVPNLANNHNGSGVLWSLGVELQIYLVFPIICAVWRRVGIAGVVAITIAIASSAQAYLPRSVSLGGANLTIIGGTVTGLCPTFYVVFAIGLVAATLFFGRSPLATQLRERTPWGLLLLAFIIVLCTRISRWGLMGDPEDYLVGLFMLLLTMSIGRYRPLRWFFERPIPVQLGTFSYSLYLTHLPLLNVIFLLIYKVVWPARMQGNFVRAYLFHLGVGLPLMLALAWAFARLFEWPFMNSRARRAAAKHYVPREQIAAASPAAINGLPAQSAD